MRPVHRASLVALLLASGAVIHGATAQEATAPSRISATISQSFEVDSNYDLDDESPGTSYLGDTRLELGLARETRTQSLELGFDTALRALDQPDEEFEFTLGSPTGAFFDYAVEAPNAEFDSLLRYRQTRTDFRRDLDDFVTEEGLLPDDLTSEDLDTDTREQRFDVDLGGTWGTASPSSYTLRFSGTDIGYSDDATDLVPRRFGQATGAWTLRVNPVLSTIVAAEYYRYDADNAVDTDLRISEIDAGLVYEPDENLRLRGGLGYAERERTETINGEDVTETETGPTIRGDVLWTRDDFSLVGDARLTTAAPETRLGFNLRGVYELPRGQLVGRAFNRYTGDSGTGTETQVTGFGVAVERDLDTLSAVRFDVAYAVQEFLDIDEDDTTRTTATVSYRRDLTPVVSAELGYRFLNLVEDPTDADSHRVFFNIGRTFERGL